ncbi:MAG: hypothetical protein KDH20_11725 [Rhodocyclaceae bacterium]|nr:hypothetical protein [Rhodocyclaceae bacterium]
MRPMVRLMLRKGVTYTYFADMLKGIFVEIADAEFKIDGKPQSDSRISLLTGVHRKDVRRLRHEARDAGTDLPEAISLGAQLVSTWMSQTPFCRPDGTPIPLARLASAGGDLSFEHLVACVSKDIRARVVLDEWLRIGVARLDDDDCVHLCVNAFVPRGGFDEKAAYFAHNVHDHACAAVHNLTSDGPAFFERSVHYDALSAASVVQLREQTSRKGMELLLGLNQQAADFERKDATSEEAMQRITVGLFFYSEASDDSQDTLPG